MLHQLDGLQSPPCEPAAPLGALPDQGQWRLEQLDHVGGDVVPSHLPIAPWRDRTRHLSRLLGPVHADRLLKIDSTWHSWGPPVLQSLAALLSVAGKTTGDICEAGLV